MRPVVLANCASGLGAEESLRIAAIEAAFEGTGIMPEVRCVAGAAIAQAARQAIQETPTVVVAAGGDGTVSAVAGILAGSRIPLAVLPMGTLNHFARDAGIPLELKQAAEVAVSGVPRQVDVAEVNGHLFVNNSSIGIYPRTVRERGRRHTQGTSKQLATLRAAWSVLQRLPAHNVLLSIDGQPMLRTTSFVLVGNNLYETGFGRLGRRASLQGGRLGVYHARRPGRSAVLGLAARALVGRLEGSSDLEAAEATTLTIRSHRQEMRVALDGEVVRLKLPLEYRIRPGGLLVMLPRG